jgi:hypothetical protein
MNGFNPFKGVLVLLSVHHVSKIGWKLRLVTSASNAVTSLGLPVEEFE